MPRSYCLQTGHFCATKQLYWDPSVYEYSVVYVRQLRTVDLSFVDCMTASLIKWTSAYQRSEE